MWRSFLFSILLKFPMQCIPVYVLHGLAKGAKWTVMPYSCYWRTGWDLSILPALKIIGDIRGLSCWDFGAHFGIYTVGLAMRVGPDGQVAAFEPDPISFLYLQRHVTMNHLNNVKLFNYGVSDKNDCLDLIISNGIGSLLSHFKRDDETVHKDTKTIRVSTIRPDFLVEKGEIRLPDFIKVDVQGHGAWALKGSYISINKSLPLIYFSCHSRYEFEGTWHLLEPLGYKVFDPSGNDIGWGSFKSPWNQTAVLMVKKS